MGIVFRLMVIAMFLVALHEIDFPLIMTAAMIVLFTVCLVMRVLRLWAIGAAFVLFLWAIGINLGEAPAYSSLGSNPGIKAAIAEKIRAVSHEASGTFKSTGVKTGTVDEQIQALNLLLVCGAIQKEEAGRIKRSIVDRYVDRTDQASTVPDATEAARDRSKPE